MNKPVLGRLAACLLPFALIGCTGVHNDLPSDTGEADVEVELFPISAELLTSPGFAPAAAPATAAPAGAVTMAEAKRVGYEYRVGRGDVLDVYLPSLALLSAPSRTDNSGVGREDRGYPVGSDGTIYLPYVRAVPVAGLTLRDIQKRVITAMSRYLKSPEVNVAVREFRSQHVLVSGAVGAAGYQPITETPLSLVGSLAASGVANFQGAPGSVQVGASAPDLTRVQLTRAGKKYSINALAMLNSSDLRQDWLLQDGDIVHVPSGGNAVAFVMGEVKSQSLMPISPGRSTLAEVLLAAGGLNQETSKASRVYVIRGDMVAKAKVYQLDLDAVEAMILADAFPMAERDIVYVAEHGISRWNRLLRQLLPTVQQLLTGAAVNNLAN